MPKIIAPNSCAFCELTHDKHGSRLDGLHPSGVWTWVEPSDKLRLERMKRNRKIRKGFAMANVIAADKYNLTHDEWLTMYVTYHGVRRVNELGNRKYKVVKTGIGVDGRIDRVGFDAGIYGIQWANVSAVKIDSFDADVVSKDAGNALLNFLEPHKPTIDALDAKIKMLEGQLQEARAARQVIAGL